MQKDMFLRFGAQQALVCYMVNGIESGPAIIQGRRRDAQYSSLFGPVYAGLAGSSNQYDTLQTMRIGSVAGDTIMLCDAVRGGIVGDFSGQSLSGYETGYAGICNLALSSHSNRNVSMAFFDGHAELITKDRLFGDTNFQSNGLISVIGNNGNINDVSIYNGVW